MLIHRAEDAGLVGECLFSTHMALGLILNTTHKSKYDSFFVCVIFVS